MEEEEALRRYCRRKTALVRSKQQHLESSEEDRRHKLKGARGREGGECERQVIAMDEFSDHRACKLPLPDCTERVRDQTSPNLTCQGPEEQSAPPQLISMLRLKTFKEQMSRVSENSCVTHRIVITTVKTPCF